MFVSLSLPLTLPQSPQRSPPKKHEKNNQNQISLQEQNVDNGRRYLLRNRKKTDFYGIN